MDAKRPRLKHEERSRQAVEALRSATLEMILEGGIGSVNLSKIGDKAGYSRGIVHYHFGSKEILFADILDSLTRDSETAFRSFRLRGFDGIVQLIKDLEATIRDQPNTVLARILLLHEAAGSNAPTLNRLAIQYNHTVRHALERLLKDEPARIERHGLGAASCAVMILALLRGVHEQWLADRENFDVLGALQDLRRFLRSIFSS